MKIIYTTFATFTVMIYNNSAINFKICKNPDCPNGGVFVPRRVDQEHCDGKCKNRANYIKRKDILTSRYADVAKLMKIDQKLERLFKEQPDGYIYTEEMLRLLEIPVNAAVNIMIDSKTGRYVHLFSNYGLDRVEHGKYAIFKK